MPESTELSAMKRRKVPQHSGPVGREVDVLASAVGLVGFGRHQPCESCSPHKLDD